MVTIKVAKAMARGILNWQEIKELQLENAELYHGFYQLVNMFRKFVKISSAIHHSYTTDPW